MSGDNFNAWDDYCNTDEENVRFNPVIRRQA
jgi:hypothetical protein